MKNLKLILLSITCLTLFLACEDEIDFLTAENINSPDANDFVKDRATAEATVFAAYSGLQFGDLCGGGAALNLHAMSVAVKAPHYAQNGGIAAVNSLTFNSDGGFVLGSFEDLYQLIDRANLSIFSINKLDDGIIPDDVRLALLGEAHFLRALGYFWLTTTFNRGKVPLITTPAFSLEETQQNSANMQESPVIYAQIEQDLLFAQRYLPYKTGNRLVNYNGSELTIAMWPEGYKGRATWGAATGYLGKIYLYQNKNAQAIAEFEKIIDGEGSGQYSLVSDFKMNTNLEGEWNDESIFEVGFSQNPEVVTGNFGGGEGGTINETTTRGYLFAWNESPGASWGLASTTSFITELFRSDIVDETNAINFKDGNINNTDPTNFSGFSKRCNATIAFNGDGEKLYAFDLTPGQDEIGFSRANSRFRKFQNWNLEKEPIEAVSEINERLMRLADIYLMYAEALLKDRGDAGVDRAVEMINRVRDRAGVIDLQTLFGSPRTYLAGTYNSNAILNDSSIQYGIRALNAGTILEHLFNEERILEFALEGRGITWQDTRRRDDIGEWINFLNNIEYRTNNATNEFEQAAAKLQADRFAGYFSIPSIETIGGSN